MAMTHHAYGFDWRAFERHASRALESSLCGRMDALIRFARANAERMTDPDGGEPLDPRRIEDAIGERDFDFLAEAALTLFYDPSGT